MKASLVLAAAVLLSACSDKAADTAANAPPSLDEAKPAVPNAPKPAPEQGDLAAAEAAPARTDTGIDPCDLTGYDMSKMTVDQHEELVKQCQKWKEQQP